MQAFRGLALQGQQRVVVAVYRRVGIGSGLRLAVGLHLVCQQDGFGDFGERFARLFGGLLQASERFLFGKPQLLH